MNQSHRILSKLKSAHGRFVPMPTLSRIGSGKRNGWCASFTKRVSELRNDGHVIQVRDEYKRGQRHTAYALVNI